MRGAGYARTSNYVRRSSIPSRRPCLARASMSACMLVLSTPRSTSSILVQQTYGTVSTMTLPVPRLLRWARCMYGRRGFGVRPVVRLVLGLGGAMSFLACDHPSAGISSTNRWFWWWRDRCRRACDLRSLLLRGHVVAVGEVDEAGEVDEECARVNAGSDSHNLDAPYLARQRCRGKLSATNTYGTGAPCLCGTRAEGAQRADRSEHAGSLPRFGPRRTRKTLLLLGL